MWARGLVLLIEQPTCVSVLFAFWESRAALDTQGEESKVKRGQGEEREIKQAIQDGSACQFLATSTQESCAWAAER